MYMIILPETVPVWFDYAYYIFLPVTMNLGGCIVLISKKYIYNLKNIFIS